MSAETKAVDVLAVLDEISASMDDSDGDALREARDAVAELIEAASGARAALANGYEIRNRRRALELALARVQGRAE